MTSKLSARQIFKEVFHGNSNFMCPNRLKYFKTKYHAIELSKGRGIMGQAIYGVSVIDISTMESCKHCTRLFQSQTSALYYIGHIQENDKLALNKHVLWCTIPEDTEEPTLPGTPDKESTLS